MEGGEPTPKRPSAEGTSRLPLTRYRFNDPSTADVVLSITGNPGIKIYVHSAIVRCRAGYFAALLSDRWKQQPLDVIDSSERLNFTVSLTSGSVNTYISVLRLLYVDDISREIDRASRAIEILPMAQELMFEDCVSTCVRFLEAVPWTDEEELRVMDLIPHLNAEESRELLCRASLLPDSGEETVDELLYKMLLWVVDDSGKEWELENRDKLWVAKVLRDFLSRESAGRACVRAFEKTLNNFKGKLLQRQQYYFIQESVRVVGKGLLWLIDTMLQFRVADNAVKGWSELPFSDMEGSLSYHYLRDTLLNCTHRLVNAVAVGTVLAPIQIRIKLVKDWVRLLIICREKIPAMESTNKTVCLKVEETILKIMSTLPMLEAKESLQHILGYKTLQDHHIAAFNTWFHRATQARLMWANKKKEEAPKLALHAHEERTGDI